MPDPDPLPSLQTPWGVFSPGAMPTAGTSPGSAVAIPDHTLLRQIGQGAYGEVWLARNALGQYRAVKILHRRSFADDRPFEREFAGMQRFEPVSRSHESQLNILHVGRGPDHFYYVMELADDQGRGAAIEESSYAPRTLRSEVLFRGRLPVDECLRIGLALTTALGHLHRHGLVHRDIKPSNIVFVNGIPKLADIGLVAQAERTMSFVGTEGYLPPEGPGTVQADLFSLGKVLYEISTGHDRQQFPELPSNLGELPDRGALAELNEILVRACAPDVKQRYQTAAEMHADLALLQSGGSVARQRRLAGQLRFVQRAGALVTAVAVVIAAGWAWQARQTGRIRDLARLAQDSEQAARERLYAADINLAQQALRADNLRLARRLLQNHVPPPGQPDLRGFEWRYLWHQCRHEELASIPGGTNDSRVLAFSPDGRHVAVGGYSKGGTRLIDVNLRREVARLPYTNATLSLSFSPGGKLLAIGSAENIRLWDPASGQEIRSLTNAAAPAVFSPDGRFLVTGRGPWPSEPPLGSTLDLMVWRTADWTVVASQSFPISGTFSGSRDLYLQPAFGSDPERMVVLAGDAFRMVSVPALQTLRALSEHLSESHTSRPFLAVSPDTRILALPTAKGFGVRLWDLVDDRELRVLSGHADHIFSARFSPDGRWLATGSPDQTVKLWEVDSGKLLQTFRGQADEVADVAFAPDGARLVSLGITESEVKLWDARSRPRPDTLGRPLWPQGFAPGGYFAGMLTRSEPGLIDVASLHAEPFPVPHTRNKASYANKLNSLSCDGRYHAMWDVDTRSLEIWDRRQGRTLCSVRCLTPFFSFDVRHEWVTTTTTNQSGQVVVTAWQLPAGSLRWEIPCPEGLSSGIQVTPDGNYLATTQPGSVDVWRLEDDGPRRVTSVPSGPSPSGIAISPDGRLLALGLGDITLVALPSGERIGVLEGHTRKNVRLAFSPDGRTLASLADDRTGRLWHLATRRELLRFQSPEDDRDPFQLEFSPDGRALAFYRYHEEGAVISLCFAPSFAEIAAAEGTDPAPFAGPDPIAWHHVAGQWLGQGQAGRALEAATRAQGLLDAHPDMAWWLEPHLRRRRLAVLRELGQWDEAGRENLRLRGIPPRDPATPPATLDLSAYYNSTLSWFNGTEGLPMDLREVPTGAQVMAGTPFDVRGIIQLEANDQEWPLRLRPDQVGGIRVGRRLNRLHFLHLASGESRTTLTGDRIGRYLLHYADGRRVEVPIRYNVDLTDWWDLDHLPRELPEAVVAWKGQCPSSRAEGRSIRLFKRTWVNPRPEVEVTSLDFFAEHPRTHPCLVALTAE